MAFGVIIRCMDIEALIDQIPALEEEARRERKRGTEALNRAQRLERVIRDLKALSGQPAEQVRTLFDEPDDLSDDGTDIHLTGIAAVREVMGENLGRPLRASDVHSVLQQRGWISPSNQAPIRSTEVALHRMARRGEIDKVDRGVFVMRGKRATSDE